MYFYLKDKFKDFSPITLDYYVKSQKAVFKFSTGQKIAPKDWDFVNRMPLVLRGRKDLRGIKLTLERHLELLEDVIADASINNQEVTKEMLKDRFFEVFRNVKKSKKVYDLFDVFIKQRQQTGSASKSWLHKYTRIRDLLHEYKPGLMINQIDDNLVGNYAGWLRRDYNYNDNTLSRSLGFLKTFLRWATKNAGFNNEIEFTVAKYDSDQIALNESEIALLENFEGSAKLTRVRDIALVGIYSGQRFSDYSVFEKADVRGDMLIKKAEKTEHESFIPLHPKLVAILDKYDWSLPVITNQRFNEYIKELCKKAGIDREFKQITYKGEEKIVKYYKAYEKVGSHTCRRTYISLASQKKVPDEIIMKITGIRDIKTLYKYKKVTIDSVMDATEGLF